MLQSEQLVHLFSSNSYYSVFTCTARILAEHNIDYKVVLKENREDLLFNDVFAMREHMHDSCAFELTAMAFHYYNYSMSRPFRTYLAKGRVRTIAIPYRQSNKFL